MEKTVQANGKDYYVDTNPVGGHFANIFRVEYTEESGMLADGLKVLTGKPVRIPTKYLIDDDERTEVVLALGEKFAKTKCWRRSYEMAFRHLLNKARGIV